MVDAAQLPAARRRWWPLRRRRRDLRAVPFPEQALQQWQDPEVALALLYRHAEGRAIDAVDWYLEDKRGKRAWSRGLRVLAILLVVAGGLQPVLEAARPGGGAPAWGYVLLALAAACAGFDRFFGLSSGWMRAMTTAQALRRRLELLQYDWASECARAATRTVDGKLVLARLALLRAFAEDAAAVMQQETSEWVFEFQSNLVQLEASAGRAAWAGARPRPQGPREGDAARAAAVEPPVPASSPPPAR
jgi:SMODS and SLOG-associating 2TM effector domain 2